MSLFKLSAVLGLDASEYESGIKKASAQGHSFGKGLVRTVGAGVKLMAAGVAAAGSAIAAATGMAVKGYAEYEQLVGGVETLFGSSAGEVQRYAMEAYRTAGLSANEYMEQATSMSASLLKSLGGDTQKAAEYADKAIKDMSDNANKMGTDMAMIQNAYSGFTRGNFTMLDNLKLGFSGSKEGMQELLDKASELSGQKFDISSYADIVDAIHIVQEEMGITGTTAKEASQTISGSWNATKAAFSNLITGMADENANFDQLIGNFVGSASSFADNILPRIQIALEGAAQLIEQIVPVVMDRLPQIITQTLPKLVQSGVAILQALVTGITGNADILATTAFDVLGMLIEGLIEAFPQLIEAGVTILVTIMDGIAANPEKAIDTALRVVTTLVGALLTGLPRLAVAGVKMVAELLKALVDKAPDILAAGAELIGKLLEGVFSVFTSVMDAGYDLVQQFKTGIANAWDGLKKWFSELWDNLFKGRDVDVNVNHTENGGKNPKAGGMAYVPYNNFPATLHRGEAVLTSRQADDWRKGKENSGGPVIENLNVYAAEATPNEAMAAARSAFERVRFA